MRSSRYVAAIPLNPNERRRCASHKRERRHEQRDVVVEKRLLAQQQRQRGKEPETGRHDDPGSSANSDHARDYGGEEQRIDLATMEQQTHIISQAPDRGGRGGEMEAHHLVVKRTPTADEG